MFKARMRFAKEGRAKYISHLDLMHAMQRAMARCEMPLWFTEGFHQHAYISIALPLATGFSGECEFLDCNLLTETVPESMVERLNAVMPEGLRAIEIYPLSDGGKKVAEIAYSQYRVIYSVEDGAPAAFAQDIAALFARDVIDIVKRSKRGEKVVNLRDFMQSFEASPQGEQIVCLTTLAAGNRNCSPEYLTKAIGQYLPEYEVESASYHRINVLTADLQPFR